MVVKEKESSKSKVVKFCFQDNEVSFYSLGCNFCTTNNFYASVNIEEDIIVDKHINIWL